MGYMPRIFSPAEGNGRVFHGADQAGNDFTGISGYDEDDWIMVPRPGRVLPKPGHWRVTPGGKVKMRPLKRTLPMRENPLMAATCEGDVYRDDLRRNSRESRSKRARDRGRLKILRELGYQV